MYSLNNTKNGFSQLQIHSSTPKMTSQLHIHSARPKTNFQPWEKWRNRPKSWRETHRSSSYVRERNWWMNNWMGMPFQAFTFPRSQKHIFPKMGGFPIRISLPYSSHPHALTNSTTQPLLDDWAQKTKWVVNNFMGFPLWHLAFPHWPKSLNISPPYPLGNHAPIS